MFFNQDSKLILLIVLKIINLIIVAVEQFYLLLDCNLDALKMSSVDIFKSFECSIAKDGHLLQVALPLSCGHLVCKKCVPPNNAYQFKCLKCNEINKLDLSQCKEVELVKIQMENNLGYLSKIINEKIADEAEIMQSKGVFYFL